MGFDFFKPRQGLQRRACVVGNGVADLRIRDVLDIRDDESNFARHQFVDLHRFR